MQRQFGKYNFDFIATIQPLTENGKIKLFMPQSRYNNKRNLQLNAYGNGPFCKFKIPRNHTTSGVYVLTVDNIPHYVGECENLSKRYNMGYGNISPKNCFKGGQSTNCRINNLVYRTTSSGSEIQLWFYTTHEYKSVESELIKSLNVRGLWNRKN